MSLFLLLLFQNRESITMQQPCLPNIGHFLGLAHERGTHFWDTWNTKATQERWQL